VLVGKAKQVWRTKFGVSSAAGFGNNDETKRYAFADRWRDRVSIDSVLLKILKGDWQPAIIISAVVRQLDFNTTKYAVR
jgi:hypothetical protein